MNIDTVLSSIQSVAREHAVAVDQAARFPRETLDALAAAGLLGTLSATEVGGLGFGLADAVRVVEGVARECGSSAMVATMHFSGTVVLERFASLEVRRAAARGTHLSTLAFSEAGSRSHFWAPLGTATRRGERALLNARKSWVTSAGHATAYVWSSRPLAADGASTLWLVERGLPGLDASAPFDGLGLRGNDSRPLRAEDVEVPKSAMLGPDGGGFDIMMGTVLPTFNVLNAAVSIGLMEGAFARMTEHLRGARHEHAGTALIDLATIRAYAARARVRVDQARALLDDTLTALSAGRADAQLRVLECKAAADEASLEVHDIAMRVSGGAAFRKDVGVERYFRDGRAAGVMAPTTDVLYDFIGKAVGGLPLF